MTDIKVLHLSSGESIIAGVNEHTDSFTLSSPYTVTYGPSGPGIIPFCPIAETDTVVIDKKFVIAGPMLPKRAVMDAYRDITGQIVLMESHPAVQ